MTTCPDCNGEGGHVVAYPETGMHPEECRKCNGSGRVSDGRRRYTTQDGRVKVWKICPKCWGRRKKECERCEGEGYVWVEEKPRED